MPISYYYKVLALYKYLVNIGESRGEDKQKRQLKSFAREVEKIISPDWVLLPFYLIMLKTSLLLILAYEQYYKIHVIKLWVREIEGLQK